MYQEYYAKQLYQKGYLRLNETKNKDKIPKLIQLANKYRAKDNFPSDLGIENVGLRPVHRMSLQELTQQVDQCIQTKVVSDDCAKEETIHPSDATWIQDKASKKLITKKSLLRAYINLIKLKKTQRVKRRRTRPSNLTSPLKTPTRSKKSSKESS